MSIFVISQLAEYPIAPLSRELKSFDIQYEDTIRNKTVTRKWRTYSTEPVGRGVFQTLINLLQSWDGVSDKISFSRRKLLADIGFKPSGKQYLILERDLESLTSIKIKTSIPGIEKDVFCLFQCLHLESYHSWIQFSEQFHKIAINQKNQYKITGSMTDFNTLPPTAQRLFVLLGKWYKHHRVYYRQLEILCSAIPICGSTKRKRKQQLKNALQLLQQRALILSWEIRPGVRDEVVYIYRITPKVADSPSVAVEDTEQSLVQISLFLGSNMKSSSQWWKKVCRVLPLYLVTEALIQAREQVQNHLASGSAVNHRGKVLSYHCKKIAKENNIFLKEK